MGVMLCFFRTRLKVIQIRLAREHFEKRRNDKYRIHLPDVPSRVGYTRCHLPMEKPEYG